MVFHLDIHSGVYPRECGGTPRLKPPDDDGSGLSPRVRGNPQAAVHQKRAGGSIPASAGEPRDDRTPAATQTVYPRECGGTDSARLTCASYVGLSPRVRGNQRGVSQALPQGRSIPASAGEPLAAARSLKRNPVYPRECGGTLPVHNGQDRQNGLSPRVRGNPPPPPPVPASTGSIPASAGEPDRKIPRLSGLEVYPRECGGTLPVHNGQDREHGLSPRVRGNLVVLPLLGFPFRSIPASAGEPSVVCYQCPFIGVYPRECGGTGLSTADLSGANGLSPRVRGNRVQHLIGPVVLGSIPASAGEPFGPA